MHCVLEQSMRLKLGTGKPLPWPLLTSHLRWKVLSFLICEMLEVGNGDKPSWQDIEWEYCTAKCLVGNRAQIRQVFMSIVSLHYCSWEAASISLDFIQNTQWGCKMLEFKNHVIADWANGLFNHHFFYTQTPKSFRLKSIERAQK